MKKKRMSWMMILLMLVTVSGIMFGGGVFKRTAIVAQAETYYTYWNEYDFGEGYDDEFYIGQKRTIVIKNGVEGKKFKWSVKNKKIASIKAKGNKVTVTAKKAGKTYKLSIHVYAPELDEKKITIPPVISAEQVTLSPGESYIVKYVGNEKSTSLPKWSVLGHSGVVTLSAVTSEGKTYARGLTCSDTAVKVKVSKNAKVGNTVSIRLTSPESATLKVVIK